MNDVAEAAGVTKPVLYQHFDSDRDLYKALLDEVGNRLLDSIAKATAEATDGKTQTNCRTSRRYFRWVSDDHAGFRLLFGSGTSNNDEFEQRRSRRSLHRRPSATAPLIAVDIRSRHGAPWPTHSWAWPREPVDAWSSWATTSIPIRSPTEVSALAWAGLRGL